MSLEQWMFPKDPFAGMVPNRWEPAPNLRPTCAIKSAKNEKFSFVSRAKKVICGIIPSLRLAPARVFVGGVRFGS